MACGNSEEGGEGGMAGFAAVEAEDEFIEISLQMFAAQSVINAETPGFQVRKHSVDGRQNDMRRHRTDDMRLVADMRGSRIGGKPVSLCGRPGGDVFLHEKRAA